MTPDLQAAVERLERAYSDAMHVGPGEPTVAKVQAGDLRLVLDALKEAESTVETFKLLHAAREATEHPRVEYNGLETPQ